MSEMILNTPKIYSDTLANARNMLLNGPKVCCMFESTKDAEKKSSIFMSIFLKPLGAGIMK